MSPVGVRAILGLEAQAAGHGTSFTRAAGEEVLEGVLVDQPHAAALGGDAVLYLLLLRLWGQRLQLHLQRGHGQGAVPLREKAGLPWVPARTPVAPYVPPYVRQSQLRSSWVIL